MAATIYLSRAQVSHKAMEVGGLSEGGKDRVGRLIIDEVRHSKLVFPILPLSAASRFGHSHKFVTLCLVSTNSDLNSEAASSSFRRSDTVVLSNL